MPYTISPLRKNQTTPSFHELLVPVYRMQSQTPPLAEYSSGSQLVQALEKDDFARKEIAPPDGIKKSSFFEAVNHRGLEQLLY